MIALFGTLAITSEINVPKNEAYEGGNIAIVEGNYLLPVQIYQIETHILGALKEGSNSVLALIGDNMVLKKLAICESGLNPKAIGDAGTSFGLFQYKISTWNLFCKGDIWNIQDQIDCAEKMIEQGLGSKHWRNCWRIQNL